MSCPDGTLFEIQDHRCEKAFFYSNLGGGKWVSTNPQKVKEDIEEASKKEGARECPITKPYFDGSNCINCPGEDTFFSFDARTCTTCSRGTLFSINLHSCV